MRRETLGRGAPEKIASFAEKVPGRTYWGPMADRSSFPLLLPVGLRQVRPATDFSSLVELLLIRGHLTACTGESAISFVSDPAWTDSSPDHAPEAICSSKRRCATLT